MHEANISYKAKSRLWTNLFASVSILILGVRGKDNQKMILLGLLPLLISRKNETDGMLRVENINNHPRRRVLGPCKLHLLAMKPDIPNTVSSLFHNLLGNALPHGMKAAVLVKLEK